MFYALLIIIAVVALLAVSLYNRLVRLRNNRENAFADIDVQLKQRLDLVPQLVEAVKAYMKHESTVLTDITNARANAMQARGIDEKIAADGKLSSALQGLRVAVEAYPDLKASTNFIQLQEEISDIENKLAAARRFFNSATKELNNAVETFPSNLVAGMFGFKRETMYDLAETRAQAGGDAQTELLTVMKYIGLNSQIWSNNFKSVILLILFPIVIMGLVWLFTFLIQPATGYNVEMANQMFFRSVPWVIVGVGVWFVIAWFSHTSMIEKATGSTPLSRKENKRIYNLVENLCISGGMPMPKVNVINDDSLNAFASGINTSTFTVSLSRGIIDKLDDAELEAVIAHELTHIRNRDVRLLIVSIIFVGIFAFITEALVRTVRFSGGGNGKKDGRAVIIALLLAAVGYFLSSLFRFAISRQREYMADAGSANMTKNPLALASALEKISVDPAIEAVKRNDVAQMFIDNPEPKKERPVSFKFGAIFMTHPPIEKRIALLKQF